MTPADPLPERGYAYKPLAMVLKVCERFGLDPAKVEDWDEGLTAHLMEWESIRMQEDDAKFRTLVDVILAAVKASSR